MKNPVKKIVAVAVAAIGLAAGAAPSVKVNSVADANSWNVKTITYTISGAEEMDTNVKSYFVAFDVTVNGETRGVTNAVPNPEDKAYTTTIDTKALFGREVTSAAAKMRVSLIEKMGCVQLWEGGPYFATCNVGANAPEEAGYYFWWGDTVGYKRNGSRWDAVDGSKTSFSFSTANCPTYNKDLATLQSEGYIDSTGNLVAAHDAATAHLGAPWRMMTDAELQALVANCTTVWTTRNGVNGRLVTGKGDYAANSIFLPAAGYGDGSSLNYSGSYGFYWSSSPLSDSSLAWSLHFYSGYFLADYYSRYYGRPVRAVRGFAK